MSDSEKTGLIHNHFILDADLKNLLDITNKNNLTELLVNSLMDMLGMEPLGKLEIYDATDLNYPGWSFIQPITTSHISGHYFEEKHKFSHIHLDIYSCKTFDWKSAVKVIDNHLNLSDWSCNYIKREMNLKDRVVLQINGNGNKISSL